MVHKVVNFQKSGKEELMLRNIKEFLMRLTPKISFSVDPANEMSVSLGIARRIILQRKYYNCRKR